VIVQLSPEAPPTLTDLDRFDRLHAACPGPIGEMIGGELCTVDDDGEHVWLDISRARRAGAAAAGEGFTERFDAMIGYAASKGWTNAAGSHVRAHVERTDPPDTEPT